MSNKYPVVYSGDWVQPRRKGYRMVCCDCGLLHVMNFRLVKSANGGRFIQFQAFRDDRATGQLRRHLLNQKKKR